MSNKIKRIIYYVFIISLFIIIDKIIYLIEYSDKNVVLNNLLVLENNALKDDIKEITNLDYKDYEYEIGKITYNNLYNNNSYFIESNTNFENNIVLNDKGFIGILSNKKLTLVKDLNLSVRINDSIGILKNNKIKIISGDYKLGDLIYTSSMSSVKENLLIGYVKGIQKLSNEDNIEIKYLDIDTSYVVILK